MALHFVNISISGAKEMKDKNPGISVHNQGMCIKCFLLALYFPNTNAV